MASPIPLSRDDDGAGGYEQRLVVEVRNRFDGSWSHGFEVIETCADDAGDHHFRLRRLSDGVVLPVLFSADDIVVRTNPPEPFGA